MFMNEHWVAVGMADRTNEAGLGEIKKILEPLGYEVTGVPLKKNICIWICALTLLMIIWRCHTDKACRKNSESACEEKY